MNVPTKSAVSVTPNVAITTPGAMMGRISENLVSIPPEKRMMQSASMPINSASEAEWNDKERLESAIVEQLVEVMRVGDAAGAEAQKLAQMQLMKDIRL